MRILVIGSGGREHALVWKLHQSSKVKKIYCAPGNAGIEQLAELVSIKPTDTKSIIKFVKKEKVDLTVIGPEQPLVDGMVDAFEKQGLKIFGPNKVAAQLEGSKVFAKEFMVKNKIPTAKYKSFNINDQKLAYNYLDEVDYPIVIKADGLAAGKGVVICDNKQESQYAIEDMMIKRIFGNAGDKIVIEEYLTGEEASIFVLTDGERYATLASAQDHKRVLDGDLGKNTGGMGAYAPTPLITDEILQKVKKEIIEPTLDGMKKEGNPYTGCLYLGLMITKSGSKVLEYNCRFGDPETQVVVPLMDCDLAEIFMSIAERKFDPSKVKIHPAVSVCVVMASQGYPDHYETEKQILGLEKIRDEDGIVVFHAGTRKVGDKILTSGGRVLGVTSIDYSGELERAIANAYSAVEKITYDGAYYRSDIGKKAFKYLEKK